MTDKFTIRDILVYSIVGLISMIVYFLNNLDNLEFYVVKTKDYSDLTVLLLIPISYLIGHLIFGIDDILFNNILFKPLKNKSLDTSKRRFKIYNFILFGNRNLGVRKANNIDDDKFLKSCNNLIKSDKYAKAEYYQIMSDLFKGLYLITIYSLLYMIFNFFTRLYRTNGLSCFPLKMLIVHFFLLLIIWYRGRIFSAYYVKFIQREITNS